MVKNWASLQPRKQRRYILEGVRDVRRFYRSPYFLNFEPYEFQDEVSYELVHDNSIRDAVILVGMRAGKTTLGGSLSAYYLFRMSLIQDPAVTFGLLPRSPVRMTNMATSREQGKETIFDFFKNFVEESPYFQEIPDLVVMTEQIRLEDRNFRAVNLSSSSGSSVGKTSVLTSFDEADLFDDTEGKDGIQQVWSRVTKATKTLRKITNGEYGKTFTISSYGEFPIGGFMDRMIAIAQKADHMIWRKLPTWDANPLYTIDDFKEDFVTDYSGTMRDFGCDARAVQSTYIKDEEIIHRAMNWERPNFFDFYFSPNRDQNVKYYQSFMEKGEYYLTGDPSLKKDAFGIALGHTTGKHVQVMKERDKEIEVVFLNEVIIDGLYRLRPEDYRFGEIDPTHVEEIFLDICSHIPVTACAFDTWAFPILQSKLRRLGTIVENHVVRVPECDLLKDMMMYGAVELCGHDHFIKEAKELMISANGKRIDHPKHGSKDMWDAAALITWLSSEPLQERVPFRPMIARRF